MVITNAFSELSLHVRSATTCGSATDRRPRLGLDARVLESGLRHRSSSIDDRTRALRRSLTNSTRSRSVHNLDEQRNDCYLSWCPVMPT
ncbi:hypothetical protein HEK616_33320 [Streptomyces nigrescens]|uniref:Uncharacterized protein n=1 Tax=Streptomyces nigrescens TaxID=1920 RepID=A0ABM7ZTZ8_STRNI|nr:hypothetical protein HEK616_33320 [Streptomyces nigrescens]